MSVRDEATEVLELVPFRFSSQTRFVEAEISDGLRQQIANIPQQMAFKIGTAAEIVGVKTHVLRFWEKEFEMLRPKKSGQGQRMYTRREIELALMIKKLLYEDRFSIEGARTQLKEMRMKLRAERELISDHKSRQKKMESSLNSAKEELESILSELRAYRLSLKEGVS